MLLPRFLIPSSFLTLALITGCGASSSNDGNPGIKDAKSTFAGLAFMVSDYTSSALYFYDFASGAITPSLSGQSGDPLVKWVNDRLYLFNRSANNVNFVTIDPTTAGAAPSTQLATPGTGLGDPHDVLKLADGNLLLAQWAKGTLVVVDPESGATVTTLEGNTLDMSGNTKATFHPETMWSRTTPAGDEIYVAHQSRSASATADGTQQLFVFTYANRTLTPVDVDAATVGVQGYKLHASNPSMIEPASATTLVVGGMCYTGDAACTKSGFDSIDLTTKVATVAFDMSALIDKANGPAIVPGGGGVYYIQAVVAGVDPYVIKITLATKAVDKVHQFPADKGCCALYADTSSGRLYVGEPKDDGRGKLSVYTPGAAAPEIVELAGNPYSGVLVPPRTRDGASAVASCGLRAHRDEGVFGIND